ASGDRTRSRRSCPMAGGLVMTRGRTTRDLSDVTPSSVRTTKTPSDQPPRQVIIQQHCAFDVLDCPSDTFALYVPGRPSPSRRERLADLCEVAGLLGRRVRIVWSVQD